MTKKTISKNKQKPSRFCFQCKQLAGAVTTRATAYCAKDLESIKKHGVEGYDAVVLIDVKTRQITAISNVLDCSAEDVRGVPLHLQALEQALKGKVHHYEWGFEKDGKHFFYQTTLIPLRGEEERAVATVLALTRDITHWAKNYHEANMLKEGAAPQTFAQILLAEREAEKREISKSLHDEIGSSAVILTALLSLVKVSVKEGDTKQALVEIAKLDKQIKNSIERVKNIIVSLRPPSLENDGALGGSVKELLENTSQMLHIPYKFDYKSASNSARVADNVKILLYRIVQEALTNIAKYAQAKNIYVLLKRDEFTVHLVVQDDGIGFKPLKGGSIRQVGLRAMKDSVRLLGGSISIKSAPGKGTRIEVSCPCVVYGGNK